MQTTELRIHKMSKNKTNSSKEYFSDTLWPSAEESSSGLLQADQLSPLWKENTCEETAQKIQRANQRQNFQIIVLELTEF